MYLPQTAHVFTSNYRYIHLRLHVYLPETATLTDEDCSGLTIPLQLRQCLQLLLGSDRHVQQTKT